MALSSLFKRNKTEDDASPAPAVPVRAGRRGAGKPLPGASLPGAAPQPHESAAVTQARTHARRRLIGAAALLLLGVLLFPLVFETQPRSLPMDLPITVAPAKGAAATAAAAATPAPAARPALPMIIETAEPEPRPPASAASAMRVTPATPVVAAQATSAAPAPASKEPAPPAVPKASAPAVAAAPEAPGRFVVQVGAFADDATVRQTRQKVEKLGLKTYTQEVSIDGGKRVRVRVGPFASRDEAAQVLNKLKGSGLPGALLAL